MQTLGILNVDIKLSSNISTGTGAHIARINSTVDGPDGREIFLHPLFQEFWNTVDSEEIFEVTCF